MGFVWLLGWLLERASNGGPAIQNHPILEDLVVIALFDARLVCVLGVAAQIVGTALWLILLVVGQSRARKALGLACLLLAGRGIYAAKPMCAPGASAKISSAGQAPEPLLRAKEHRRQWWQRELQ